MTDTKVETDITKKSTLTFTDLYAHDKELSSVDKKWHSPASAEAIEATKKALEAKKHKVDVVDNKEAALKLLTSLDVKDKSIFLPGSTTLQEIGFTHFLQENKGYAKRNFKAEVLAAQSSGAWAKSGALLREGQSADVVFSSVPAIAQTGEIYVVCATGSRTGSFVASANSLVLVVGSNKITADYATALKRTREFALPVESARSRIAYAAMGVKGSSINFEATLHTENPFGPGGRVHIILVKEALGY